MQLSSMWKFRDISFFYLEAVLPLRSPCFLFFSPEQRKTKVFVKTYLSLGDLNLEGLEMGLSFLGRD